MDNLWLDNHYQRAKLEKNMKKNKYSSKKILLPDGK